nr:nucleotidyl transferase AbiEii/AbiGii toxin family protein [Rathayibacter sp. VKM Ac-2857]
MDLAVDWRSSAPTSSDVGPVLSVEDAVGSKVVAIYGRTEARDFLDLDSIRRSGRFSDAELLRLAAERDDGFEAGMYARQLGAIERIREERFAEYGVNGEELAAVRRRILEWADIILSSDGRPEP